MRDSYSVDAPGPFGVRLLGITFPGVWCGWALEFCSHSYESQPNPCEDGSPSAGADGGGESSHSTMYEVKPPIASDRNEYLHFDTISHLDLE